MTNQLPSDEEIAKCARIMRELDLEIALAACTEEVAKRIARQYGEDWKDVLRRLRQRHDALLKNET